MNMVEDKLPGSVVLPCLRPRLKPGAVLLDGTYPAKKDDDKIDDPLRGPGNEYAPAQTDVKWLGETQDNTPIEWYFCPSQLRS